MLVEPFAPRFPWYGGDLQTLRNSLIVSKDGLEAWPWQRLDCPLPDGDRLLAAYHPAEASGRPVVLLIHGLTGCEVSSYIQVSAQQLLTAGYGVLRLNLRAAGPSGPLCRHSYHAGRSEDLRTFIKWLREEEVLPVACELLAVGYSLGGNMLLKFMAELGGKVGIEAAVSVSAPIDLAAASRRIMAPRNAFYQAYLLKQMRRELVDSQAEIPLAMREAAMKAKTVYDFDDKLVAPRNGFRDAEDYYSRCSAKPQLEGIEKPTLLLHARDDPWIPVESYASDLWERQTTVKLVLAASGGHVGFHDKASSVPWHDRQILRFFDGVKARAC